MQHTTIAQPLPLHTTLSLSLSLSLSPLASCDPISLTDPSTRDFDMIFVIMCNFLLTMVHFDYGDSVLGCIFRVFSPPTKH